MKYIDIGHGLSDSTLWIVGVAGRLATAPSERGTHTQIWGAHWGQNNWRGRFDHTTKILSAMAPLRYAAKELPEDLWARLDRRFSPLEAYVFGAFGDPLGHSVHPENTGRHMERV